ncbi:MAG: hypothetical protein K2V38_02020 [Gemmataceae bacterium]|nr:hypothetical protein [Gemmataceae bacterium]
MRRLLVVVLLVGVTSCRSADEKREIDRARSAESLALPPSKPTRYGNGHSHPAPKPTTPRPGR